MSSPTSSAERWLKLLLRLTGAMMCVAVVAMVMPTSWMAWCHEWLGLGAFPEQPVAEYLARATSAVCALVGALLILAASDVRRYRPAITIIAVGILVIAVAVDGRAALADRTLGLYTATDGVIACILSVAILALQAKVDRTSTEPAP